MERRSAKKYQNCTDSSGNDSTYDSQQDTESNMGDSDEEYSPFMQTTRKTSGKRLSAEKENGVGKNKRMRSSMSPGNGVRTGEKIHRMPTRRPDPKVFNRNALMARENRRKKKELLEKLENEVFELREKSKKLHKNLFKQSEVIKNLKKENQYLQGVIGNQTEIVKLLKAINASRIPVSSSVQRIFSQPENPRRGFPSPDSSTPLFEKFSSKESTIDSGMQSDDPFLWESLISQDPFLFADSGDDCLNTQMSPCSNLEEWDEIYPLGFDSISDFPGMEGGSRSSIMTEGHVSRVSINSEHNYFNHLDPKTTDVGKGTSGVCLHVASGKVSLEFCASCHQKAIDSWTLAE
ncbi:uncharacterized protein DMENIID0001_074140 [Sergentomyia squamirostris]